ncbi:MAG: hypothetical protein WEA61_00325 [Anaerolineales bacterium]
MTKIKTLLICTFAFALLLAACGPSSPGTEPTAAGEVTTSAPTATTEPSATPEPTIASNCSNPYYPVIEGATYTYITSSADLGSSSFTETITEVRPDGFTLSGEFEGGLVRTQEWECTAGGLVSLQFAGGASASIAAAGLSGEFETTDAIGVTLPANPVPGDTWQQSFNISGEMDMGEAGLATAGGTITLTFEAVSIEEVTTAAGTFTALRVESQSSFDLTVSISGLEIPVVFNGSTVIWYGEGIGWLKSEETATIGEGGSFASAVELQSYFIP